MARAIYKLTMVVFYLTACFLFCRRAASTVGDQGGDWLQSLVLVRWCGDRDCRALELIIRSLMQCAIF